MVINILIRLHTTIPFKRSKRNSRPKKIMSTYQTTHSVIFLTELTYWPSLREQAKKIVSAQALTTPPFIYSIQRYQKLGVNNVEHKSLPQIETLPKGESLIYIRENFCRDVDEEDRIIYMSVARKMAAQIKCDLAVAENTLTFTKKD